MHCTEKTEDAGCIESSIYRVIFNIFVQCTIQGFSVWQLFTDIVCAVNFTCIISLFLLRYILYFYTFIQMSFGNDTFITIIKSKKTHIHAKTCNSFILFYIYLYLAIPPARTNVDTQYSMCTTVAPKVTLELWSNREILCWWLSFSLSLSRLSCRNFASRTFDLIDLRFIMWILVKHSVLQLQVLGKYNWLIYILLFYIYNKSIIHLFLFYFFTTFLFVARFLGEHFGPKNSKVLFQFYLILIKIDLRKASHHLCWIARSKKLDYLTTYPRLCVRLIQIR